MYEREWKETRFRTLRRSLRKLMKECGIVDFRISQCFGGPAISGEILCHSEEVYICVDLDKTKQGHNRCTYYRTCKGKDDFRGGSNHRPNTHDGVPTKRDIMLLLGRPTC